jgi:hypothetical protein
MNDREILSVLAILIGGVLVGGSKFFGRRFTDGQDAAGSPAWRAMWDRYRASRPRWERMAMSRRGRLVYNTIWFAVVGAAFIYMGIHGLAG